MSNYQSAQNRVLADYGLPTEVKTADGLLAEMHQRRKRNALMKYFNATGQSTTAQQMMQTGIIPEPYNSIPKMP